VTVSTLVHTIIQKEATGARYASMMLPGLENYAALHASAAYCYDVDGSVHRAAPIGEATDIVADIGGLVVTRLDVSDEGWPLVQAGFTDERPMVTAGTLEEFVTVCAGRFADLHALISTHRPEVAGLLDGDPANAVTQVRGYLLPVTYADPIVQSIRVWVVARLGGSETAFYPGVFYDKAARTTDYENLSTFWQSWQSSDETSDLRLITRLWEYARMGWLASGISP
jgi:hypothetical protein